MNQVKVIFSDPQYNYTTDVSDQATEQSCIAYFVGESFNVAAFPAENMQTCIGIEFCGMKRKPVYSARFKSNRIQ
jgi:hypothetical protein